MDLARIRHNAARYADQLRRSQERMYAELGTTGQYHGKGPYLSGFCSRLINLIDSEPGRREKIMRWYGFVQGALWVLGEYTVDELKEHSNPDAPLMGELGALKSCLRYHQKRGTYRGEPASVIPDMRGAYVPRDRALTIDEFGALLSELSPDRRDYLVAYVGLGASMSELYRIEAIDVRADTVRVPGTKRETRDRWVPLRPEVRAVLKRRAKSRTTGALFAVWGNARRDLAQACERAGIHPVSHNDLRRTFATWLGEAGVPEAVTASLMGHSSSAMVRTKIGRDAQKEAVAKLPKLGGR